MFAKRVQSGSVNEEIRLLKAIGREKRVLAFIVDGEPNANDKSGSRLPECFPETLRFRLDPSGKLSKERAEPIAADARREKDGKRNGFLKLVTGILGIPFADLKQRDQERQRRFWTSVGIGALAGLTVFGLLARYANLKRVDAIAERLATDARVEVDRHPDLAMLLAVKAVEIRSNVQTKSALLSTLHTQPQLTAFLHHGETGANTLSFSDDGKILTSGGQDGSVQQWNVHGRKPLGKATNAFIESGHSVAFSPDSKTVASLREQERYSPLLEPRTP